MIHGARLSHLFVHVRSMAETRRFYVDLLGLEILVEEPGYLRIGNADGWHMGMEEAEPIGADGIELVIGVDNVDEAYRRLADAGVAFDSAPHWRTCVRVARDLAGVMSRTRHMCHVNTGAGARPRSERHRTHR
jgi:catechol 2,3-dioxygenase-like lactoylglutathione lyase family enzyme